MGSASPLGFRIVVSTFRGHLYPTIAEAHEYVDPTIAGILHCIKHSDKGLYQDDALHLYF